AGRAGGVAGRAQQRRDGVTDTLEGDRGGGQIQLRQRAVLTPELLDLLPGEVGRGNPVLGDGGVLDQGYQGEHHRERDDGEQRDRDDHLGQREAFVTGSLVGLGGFRICVATREGADLAGEEALPHRCHVNTS